MRRAALAAAMLLGSPACAQETAPQNVAAQETVPANIRAVIERTRNPSVDYTVVHIERVTHDGRTFEQTSAEFERGDMHRVETASVRVIANCATGATIAYSPAEDRIQRSPTDPGACGIADAEPVQSSRMLPPETGPWGRADVIELTGPDFVRRYVVTEDGIIVSGSYRPRRPDVRYSVEPLRVVVTRGAPDPAMFEEESLRRTFAQPLPETAPPSP